MFTKKGYLVSVGELPPGSENKQGRLSLAHEALCQQAVSDGVQIQGYSVSATATPSVKSGEVVKAKPAGEKGIVEPAPYLYPEDQWQAFEIPSRVSRSMREACRHCRHSLVGCGCNHPEIVKTDGTGNVKVSIERKSDN